MYDINGPLESAMHFSEQEILRHTNSFKSLARSESQRANELHRVIAAIIMKTGPVVITPNDLLNARTATVCFDNDTREKSYRISLVPGKS